MRKTQDEIDAEIAALKELLPQLPNYKTGIEISIRVLDNKISHDGVYDAYEGEEVFDDALCVVLWRDGMSDDQPSALFREML